MWSEQSWKPVAGWRMPSRRKPHLSPELGKWRAGSRVRSPISNLETNYEENDCKNFQPTLIHRSSLIAAVDHACLGAEPASATPPTPPARYEYARDKLDEDTDRKRRLHCDASGSQHGSEVRESADQACDLRFRRDEIRPAAWQKRPTLRRHRNDNSPADVAAGIPQDEGLCLRWSGEHRRPRPARPHYDHVLNARTDLRGNEQQAHLRSLSQ